MTVRDETDKTPGETGTRSPTEGEAYLKQYVEALRGEPARQHALQAACWLVAAAYRRLQ